jgi:hypothetical protein
VSYNKLYPESTTVERRSIMGQAALVEAQQRSWSEAMKCPVRGYEEVIETQRAPVAA